MGKDTEDKDFLSVGIGIFLDNIKESLVIRKSDDILYKEKKTFKTKDTLKTIKEKCYTYFTDLDKIANPCLQFEYTESKTKKKHVRFDQNPFLINIYGGGLDFKDIR